MLKLFLVDDDRFVRIGLRNLIDWEGCGFEVCAESDNGENALDFILSERPDVVITDIKMPVLDGLELIKKVTETLKSSPSFIILSGYSDFRYAQKAVRYGVHDFLLKPIEKEEMENTLVSLSTKLAKKRLLKHNMKNIITIASLDELLSKRLFENMPFLEKSLLNQIVIHYMIIEINNRIVDINVFKNLLIKIDCLNREEEFMFIQQHNHGGFGLVLLSLHKTSHTNHIVNFAEKLQEKLAKLMETEISIYIGKTIKKLFQLKESYETAKLAAQYKYVEPTNKPIIYESISQKSINYTVLDQALYTQLIEKIEEYDQRAILETIDIIMVEFQKNFFARDAVRTSINRFVHEIVKTIKALDGKEQQLSTISSMLHWDERALTLKQIKELFTDFILESTEMIALLNKDNAQTSIYQVKKYIDTHYQNNLTLKGIANTFYMNPVYMGQLFKKTFGIYFKDYYLHIRIEHAKKMLRQTDKRIYEIAESVGFANSDYFVTQFEKKEGVTPSKYRYHFMNKVEGSRL